ncbi:glycosyl hydrolase [Sporodiniella umbellata]|nr:glycosyl hydrolase [Sporodiniella umbellata]
MRNCWLLLVLNVLVSGSSAAWPPRPGVVKGDILVHDPAMIKRGNTYYLFGTHDSVSIKKSTDRINFKNSGSATPWMGSKDVWAPDVSQHGNQYLLYYSTSTFGTQESCIYMATSNTLESGSFTDKGKVICSTAGSAYNAIDPNLVKGFDGNLYLSFGSFYGGLYVVQLDATGKVLTTKNPKLIARRSSPDAMEGPFIYTKNNYYYLFMSWGNCCVTSSNLSSKNNEPYHIKVCKSKSIYGPYVDAAGTSCTNGGGLEILKGQSGIWGVGGQGILKDRDGDVLYYHYYDSKDNYNAKLGVNLLTWDKNGWPIAY